MKYHYTTITFLLLGLLGYGQDFIRANATFTPDSANLLGTFTFSLNRAESDPKDEGRHFLYTPKWYIVPSIEMNIGRDVSSSNNDVLSSLRAAYTHKKLGETWKLGFELAPTFHSDKNFVERLFYVTPKIYYNQVWTEKPNYTKSNGTSVPYLSQEIVLGFGISGNIGQRFSQAKDTVPKRDNFYSTAGGFLEFSIRRKKIRNAEPINTWNGSLSVITYGILADRESLTTKDVIHYVKLSVGYEIRENIELSLAYKHGTDNPFYTQTHGIDLGVKVGFGIFD